MIRIAVVEDNKRVRTALWNQLKRLPDVIVVTFTCGEDLLALKADVQTHYRVVITDGYLGWTRMDGPTLTQKIKSGSPKTKFIGYTNDDSLRVAFRKSGIHNFIERGDNLEPFVEAVVKAVKGFLT